MEITHGSRPVDVVIVGGGPAGSTLGTLLANAGYDAVLLERERHPRDHVGELIQPSVNAILHRIGLLEDVDKHGFARREGLAWTGPCLRDGQVTAIRPADFPPPRALRRYGYNVDRSAFDLLLLRHAERAGVRLLQGAASKVMFEGGRAVGIEVRDPCGQRQVRARFVVDASGRRSLLGSQLGLKVRESSLQQCALYSWFRGAKCGPFNEQFAFLHLLRGNMAWAWQIPLGGGLTSVGLVVDRREFPRNAEYDAFFRRIVKTNPTVQPFLEGAHLARPWAVEGDYSYRMERMTGRGWLLVGDAAGFIDPVFASGVDIAMHSAFFAYQALLPLLRLERWSDDDEMFQAHRYEDRVRRGMGVWRHMVDAFYQRPAAVGRVAGQVDQHAMISRLLQGNPYEIQNNDIADNVFHALSREAE